ncbi:MAG: acyl-[acyl-carrier-protein]--UDP-N-acetylglucosamine O-acyltransferase [Candidatus Lambdaproteobacteria bacterium RIFOXYD12_FULL_49_8]|nr:MAG: acyl-[acyl-carrier-protein]--UDP-N-acetylglucosamine O-acyltransferase [Candidatus Lambdaproteobacteria bacterium RIFOXYD12_FULL_49_8]
MTAKSLIHKTALVDSKAELDPSVEVGPYALIGPEVKIQAGTVIAGHVTIQGKTEIGKNNQIGAYCTIGLPAQDKACRNDPGRVVIGDHNDIREYVSIHRGTTKEQLLTQLGSGNQIFVYSHFAHDTELGDNCMLANNTTLGGHVKFGSNIVTGGLSAYHQFTRVGSFAMVGGMTAIYQDVPPYMLCSGGRGVAYGINRVGLQRNGFSSAQVAQIQGIYNQFFASGLVPSKALAAVKSDSDGSMIYQRFIDFIEGSKRGIVAKG